MRAALILLASLLLAGCSTERHTGIEPIPVPACTTTLDGCRLDPCPSDDGPAVAGQTCYWDAALMGDGQGTSFWVDSTGATRPYRNVR